MEFEFKLPALELFPTWRLLLLEPFSTSTVRQSICSVALSDDDDDDDNVDDNVDDVDRIDLLLVLFWLIVKLACSFRMIGRTLYENKRYDTSRYVTVEQ